MIADFLLSPCRAHNSRNTRKLSSMIGTGMRVSTVELKQRQRILVVCWTIYRMRHRKLKWHRPLKLSCY